MLSMRKFAPMPTPNQLDVALGLHIRQRRKSLGMSQTALADAVGITFQQIQKYERGFNRVSFSRLVEIAHAIKCRVVDLVGDLDETTALSPAFRDDTAHFRVNGAPELLAAYAVIPHSLQRPILKLVVKIAEDQHAREPADGAPVTE
jgi:transcriptional regulator with XRE-family HTH domain